MNDVKNEYDIKISKIKKFLDKENENLDSSTDLNRVHEVIIGMAPKVVGTFLEQILRHFYNIDESGNVNSSSDGIHQTEEVEVKSSRAIYTTKENDSLSQYDLLFNYNRRLLSVDELDEFNFDCNMQQIKPKLFDKLYYGILTKDGFLVFKMNKNLLLHDQNISYCDKQHKGNIGEGQFHVKKANIRYHLLHYYEGTISWHKILEILKKIPCNN